MYTCPYISMTAPVYKSEYVCTLEISVEILMSTNVLEAFLCAMFNAIVCVMIKVVGHGYVSWLYSFLRHYSQLQPPLPP